MSKRTQKEKIVIIEESKIHGSLITARKHGVGYSTLMRWKQEYELGGEKSLKSTSSLSDQEVKKMLLENKRLKELVADKELQIKIQLELIKKNK
jgi:putative transposase